METKNAERTQQEISVFSERIHRDQPDKFFPGCRKNDLLVCRNRTEALAASVESLRFAHEATSKNKKAGRNPRA